ncbi:MAG: hypothetical protein AAF840_12700, partial [Bacteroidota bacterium]
MKLNVKLIFLSLSALFIWSCQEEKEWPVPDVAAISSPVKLIRFDQDLLALDTAEIARGKSFQVVANRKADKSSA